MQVRQGVDLTSICAVKSSRLPRRCLCTERPQSLRFIKCSQFARSAILQDGVAAQSQNISTHKYTQFIFPSLKQHKFMIKYFIMKRLFNILFVPVASFITFTSNGAPLDPAIAITNARMNCDGISQTFKSMKTMAQINTAVTGVGTAAGAGATIVGIAKANVDKEIEKLIHDVKQRETQSGNTRPSIDESQDFIDGTTELVKSAEKNQTPQSKLEQKSKNLGNWRTGLLAGNTATNIAGTIIAANNRTDEDLRTQIDKCIRSIHDLQDSKIQAHIDNTDSAIIQKMDNIINACRDYSTLDVSQIDTKAKGATISSGVGIAVGTAGTITSATANSDKIRNDNTDKGIAKEKNLNTASNVLAAGATVASGVATVFNSQQISTLNRAHEIATQCSEALNQ